MFLKGVQQSACKQKKRRQACNIRWANFGWYVKTAYVLLSIENPPKCWNKTAKNSIHQNNNNNNNNNNNIDDDNKW